MAWQTEHFCAAYTSCPFFTCAASCAFAMPAEAMRANTKNPSLVTSVLRMQILHVSEADDDAEPYQKYRMPNTAEWAV